MKEANENSETIITSFPRRWGRNKPDSSGVHNCLRETIKKMEAAGEEIRSAYHLGKFSLNASR
jgi:hypothetical protein